MEEEVQEIAEEVKELVKENRSIKCDFIGKTETGMKIHTTAKHNVSLMKMYRNIYENKIKK